MKLITKNILFVLLLCCCFCCCLTAKTCWLYCPESQRNFSELECFLIDDGASKNCYARFSEYKNVSSVMIDLTSKVQDLFIDFDYILNLKIGAVQSHPDINQLRIEDIYTDIRLDLFDMLPGLTNLVLVGAKFQFFPYFSDSNPLLAHLRVYFSFTDPDSNNSILWEGRVSGLTQLKTLELYPRQFLNATDESFSGLTALTTLSLTEFHAHNPVATFSPLVKLDQLFYRDSELADISFLSQTPSLFGLTYLSFSNNKITHIPTNVFLNYTNLAYLDLNSNKITSLEKDCFKGLRKLETLRLDVNQLKELSTTAFGGLESLTFISLNTNPICHLSSKTFESLKQPDILELHDVPLCCDCNLKWMSKADFDIYSPYCASPPQYVNRSATDPDIYVNCPPESVREGILTL